MARLFYGQRKQLATEYEHFCRVTGKASTIPRFLEWMQAVKKVQLQFPPDPNIPANAPAGTPTLEPSESSGL